MEATFDQLNQLIESHGLTVADLEYIVKYLIKENISPQLAMRRIKSFEILKAKLEDNTDQELIKALKEQLEMKEQTLSQKLQEKEKEFEQKIMEKETILKEIINEKTSLEDKKKELETMSDLFDSEREELRTQLKMLQEMAIQDEKEAENESLQLLRERFNQFIDDIKKLSKPDTPTEILFKPIYEVLVNLQEEEYQFNVDAYSKNIEAKLEKIIKPSLNEEKYTESKQFISTDINEEEKKIKKEKKKVEKTVPQKVIQILDLFLDFLKEAKTDKDFQNRVDTICEMDEAYENLGSIGLSQIYSYVSKKIDKKDELVQMIKDWKIEGVPR